MPQTSREAVLAPGVSCSAVRAYSVSAYQRVGYSAIGSPDSRCIGQGEDMVLLVWLDYETSEHAGAGGMFQIESIEDDETSDDLTDRVDVGMHFNDVEELTQYLKAEFGNDTIVDVQEP